MRFSPGLLLAAVLLGGCAVQRIEPPATGLQTRLFGESKRDAIRTLIVVLHGDAPSGERADPYGFAERAVDAIPHSAALAIIRPGYGDSEGNRSAGERGKGVGDNYTLDQLKQVGDAILAAKAQLPQARVVVVGDGGGAAIAADLAGIRPKLIDGIVLVSCPCTLPEWRKYMKKQAPRGGWQTVSSSLDPLKTAGGVQPGLRAAMLVGAQDKVTPDKFSRPYAEALALRGIATDYRIVPQAGRLTLNDPQVLEATQKLVSLLPEKQR